jgi:hypothetical protein
MMHAFDTLLGHKGRHYVLLATLMAQPCLLLLAELLDVWRTAVLPSPGAVNKGASGFLPAATCSQASTGITSLPAARAAAPAAVLATATCCSCLLPVSPSGGHKEGCGLMADFMSSCALKAAL